MRLILLFLLLSTSISYSQTIQGTILDKQSKFPIPGVLVKIMVGDSLIRTLSKDDGVFRIENLPVGRYSISFSYTNYKTVSLSNISVISGKELELPVELEENITEVEEVEITYNADKRKNINEMLTVSSRTISIEEAGRYAGSRQDFAKVAQNYPGVSGANDARNDIIIRGNSPTGVLWRMEGIDIPSPNHFSSLGTTGGPVCMLNLNNLSNSDFTTSAWSADYGNALSGVFDLQLRNGNTKKREYLGQIGFNGFEFGMEGPFKRGKNATYILNYRYSTLALIKAIGVNLGTGASVPFYQDVTFKVDLPTKKAGRFSLFGIGGISSIKFETDSTDENNLYFGENIRSDIRSRTGIIGFSHRYFFDEKTFSKLVIAVSGTRDQTKIDSIRTNSDAIRYYGSSNEQTKYSLNYKVNRKFNARNTATIGIIYDYIHFNLKDSVRNDLGGFDIAKDYRNGTSLIQTYILYQHRFTEKLTLNSGVHSQTLLLNGSNSTEPRVGLKYQLNENHAFSFGSGLHSQMQFVTSYFQEEIINGEVVLSNKEMDFTKSFQNVLGYDWFIQKNLRLKTEAYYQLIYDAPVHAQASSYSMLNAGDGFGSLNETGLINKGTGKNYGIELTIEKMYTKGYYILFTSSLFESRYKGSDGIERSTTFNTNYVFNLAAGNELRLGKKSLLRFDAQATFAGGRREIPVDLEASIAQGKEVRDETRAYAVQNTPYFKVNFKITYELNLKKLTSHFSIDLQNLTNHKNLYTRSYSTKLMEVVNTYQTGFYPNVTYRIQF